MKNLTTHGYLKKYSPTAKLTKHGRRVYVHRKVMEDYLSRRLELNEDISRLTYILLDQYSLKFSLGIADALIASTAIYNKIPLWTSNKKHFNNIKEKQIKFRVSRRFSSLNQKRNKYSKTCRKKQKRPSCKEGY